MKRQTLILVMIGVILFIAGSAIAYASVKGASKHAGSGANVRGPREHLGRRGQGEHPGRDHGAVDGLQRAWSPLSSIPTKTYTPTDLAIAVGLDRPGADRRRSRRVMPSARPSSRPARRPSPSRRAWTRVTVTMTGANGLAGYLQPGGHVDVYANITKVSTGSARRSDRCRCRAPSWPWPNIQVLDVQSTVPDLRRPARSTAGAHHSRRRRRCCWP